MQDLNYGDDSFNIDTYQQDGQIPMPAPGVYEIKATSVAKKTNRDTGELVLAEKDGVAYPTVVIQRIAIVDPEVKGTHAIFESISGKPYKRGGTTLASRTMDALMAVDLNLAASLPKSKESWLDAVGVLEQELTAGTPLQVKLGYMARDTEAAVAELNKLGPDADTQTKNDVWNKHTFKTKAFKRLDGSGYLQSITSPHTGKVLNAKLCIDTFIPSTKKQRVGAF